MAAACEDLSGDVQHLTYLGRTAAATTRYRRLLLLLLQLHLSLQKGGSGIRVCGLSHVLRRFAVLVVAVVSFDPVQTPAAAAVPRGALLALAPRQQGRGGAEYHPQTVAQQVLVASVTHSTVPGS